MSRLSLLDKDKVALACTYVTACCISFILCPIVYLTILGKMKRECVLLVCHRFSWGLGMRVVAKSDLSTGNNVFASYVLQSNDLVRSAGTASLQSTFACLSAAHTLVPSVSPRQVHVSAAPVAGA